MEAIRETIKRLGDPQKIPSKMAEAASSLPENTGTLPSTNCQYCGGLGSVHPCVDGVVDYGQVIACSCMKDRSMTRRQEALLKYCELPPIVADMRFDNFHIYPEVKSAHDKAWQVAQSPHQLCWLVFQGLNDTGKTHLAISICRAWIEAGVAAKYVFVPLLLDELREGFKKQDDESYTERFKRYCNVPLLMLDDLGAESATAWVNEKLETLVDYRFMNKLSLIVTTNKTIEELSPRLGSRLVRHPNARLIAITAREYTLRRTSK